MRQRLHGLRLSDVTPGFGAVDEALGFKDAIGALMTSALIIAMLIGSAIG